MRKFFLLIAILIAFNKFQAIAQEKYVTDIPIETGERWWGMDDEGRAWTYYMEKYPFAHKPDSSVFKTRMLISNMGRYIWNLKPVTVRLNGDRLFIESPNEKIEIQKAGKTLREAYIVCVHKNLSSGRQIPASNLLTHPVYRPDYRPDITWGQEEIVEYARKIVSEGLPLGTIVIPEGWCSINIPFTFSHEIFPDPQKMIDELHEMGFKVMLTVIPRTPAAGKVYTDAYRSGNIVSRSRLLETHMFIGVFNIADDNFFASYRKDFEEFRTKYSFDGYRLNCNYSSGYASDDPFMLNWEKLAEGIGMCEMTGTYKRPFSPYVSEINELSYDHYKKFMHDNLFASSLSGDIYKTANCSNIYLKEEKDKAAYMVAALFFPVASVDFVPWELKEQKLYDHVKTALIFRASLAEYMDNLVKESAKTGEPIVRHMEYQFPRQGFSDCDGQYMLGPKYLIVPCMDGGNKCMVRLPKGRWADKNGNRFKGPLVTEADCSDGMVYFELVK